jgi:hypothetical protein
VLDLTQAASYNPAFITANGGNVANAEAVFVAGFENDIGLSQHPHDAIPERRNSRLLDTGARTRGANWIGAGRLVDDAAKAGARASSNAEPL